MSRIHFDHIAIATHRMADAPAVLVGVLGGTPTGDGGPSGAYTWGHWRFAGGGRLEILEPLGADGFLHRFLATRGPGIHHVTFRVPSLAEACERAGAHGLRIVGRDESDPAWAEAFLHPKEALGLVVQLAESRVAEMRPPFVAPPGPAQPPPAVTVLGLRTRARTAERAHTLWGAVLQGHRAEAASDRRARRGAGRDAAPRARDRLPPERRVSDDSLEVERRVVAVLDGLGVAYELQPIDPAFADTAAYCERYGVPLDHAANTIVVASKKEPRQFAACVVKATTRLDVNRTVRRLLNASKVSFASAEETRALTGMLIGGVTVFALPPDLPIYVDDKVLALEWAILGSGSRSSKVRVSPEVLRRLPGVQVVPLSLEG